MTAESTMENEEMMNLIISPIVITYMTTYFYFSYLLYQRHLLEREKLHKLRRR